MYQNHNSTNSSMVYNPNSRLDDVSSLGQVVKKFNGSLIDSLLTNNQEKQVTRSQPIDIPKPGRRSSLEEGKILNSLAYVTLTSFIIYRSPALLPWSCWHWVCNRTNCRANRAGNQESQNFMSIMPGSTTSSQPDSSSRSGRSWVFRDWAVWFERLCPLHQLWEWRQGYSKDCRDSTDRSQCSSCNIWVVPDFETSKLWMVKHRLLKSLEATGTQDYCDQRELPVVEEEALQIRSLLLVIISPDFRSNPNATR